MKKQGVRRQELVVRRQQSTVYYLLTPIFFFFLSSCHAQKPVKPYYEDLSSFRPKVKWEQQKRDSAQKAVNQELIPAKHNINAKVDSILDSINRFNLTRKFVDGYTIQIYSGQKRDEALNVQKKLVEENSGYNANIQYQQPKFRVTVGRYFTRIEAQKDLLALKRLFSSASLVPERIMIK